MLKMIIADDESIAREGILNIVNWNELGIEIIAEASDGQEAYNLCMKYLPDILFTDIRMPVMDGLEVAEKLKENGIDVKVIIFSGIQDFGYAKSALNINAEGYILKPLDVLELTEVIQRVVKKINNEKSIEQKVRNLKQQLHEHFGAAREKFLKNIILGAYQNEKDIINKLEYFNEPFLINKPIVVAALQIDEYARLTENYNEEEKQLLGFSIVSIAEELINNYTTGSCVAMNDNEFVMIFNSEFANGHDKSELFSAIIDNLNKYLKISVSIGVGREVTNILRTNVSYKEAVEALYFKFYTGKNAIIDITDINLADNEIPDLYAEENELVNFIKSGNVEETETSIRNLFNKLSLDKKYTVEYIHRICDEIVYITTRAIYELGLEIGGVNRNRAEILNDLYQTESIFELQRKMTEILVDIAKHFSQKYTQKNKKIVDDIMRYIEKKYMDDINIKKIADIVYLSPNYISVLFKQMTGITIIDYLTKTRMENAKILLKETDFRILEIAEMVGFQDASYFSKVFKKYTGIYPQKYRAYVSTLEAKNNDR